MTSNDSGSGRQLGGEETSSFFLDGLTLHPGAGNNESQPLPEPTEEFRFLRVLGTGGMGIVYEAEEKRTGRRVALKVIAPQLRLSQVALTRFESEARSAAALSHPNCVFVYGAYRVGDSPAIAMELMTGDTLADVIKNGGAASVQQAALWATQILEGLHAAHDAGLVHRDVKPSNIFLTAENVAKVGDFGLTRNTDTNLSLTQSGMFLGSPLYASPEQIRGQHVDRRSDIYSVGATLYALLCGRPPHESDNIGDLFARIATEEPPSLKDLGCSVSPDLQDVMTRALAKNPEDRFQDCQSFQDALGPFLDLSSGRSPRLLHRWSAYALDSFFFFVLPHIAWSLIFNVAGNIEIRIDSSSASLPTLCAELTFLLYIMLSEGRTGASFGKRILGLRVVTRDGSRPGMLRALIRVMVLECTYALKYLGFTPGLWSFLRFPIILGPMRRRTGMRGLHEILSDTRVVELKDAFFKTGSGFELLDPERRAPVAATSRCGHYILESHWHDTDLGQLWVGRDERLGRDVWIVAGKKELSVKGESLARGQLHFLDRVENDDGTHLVFESPGGASLFEYRAMKQGLPWHLARSIILELIRLRLDQPDLLAANRLWVGRGGHLRLLPFALHEGEVPEEVLPWVVSSVLAVDQGQDLPEDIPEDARSDIQALLEEDLKTEDLVALYSRLEQTDSHPRSIPILVRATQLVFTSLIPLSIAAAWLRDLPDEPMQHPLSLGDLIGTTGLILGTIVMPPVVMAALLRGGLGFQLFGIRVVDERAHRTGRTTLAVRAILTWLPLAATVLLTHIVWITTGHPWAVAGGWILLGLFVLVSLLGLKTPSRSLVDIKLGTVLVR